MPPSRAPWWLYLIAGEGPSSESSPFNTGAPSTALAMEPPLTYGLRTC
jgi:hypothetical protein